MIFIGKTHLEYPSFSCEVTMLQQRTSLQNKISFSNKHAGSYRYPTKKGFFKTPNLIRINMRFSKNSSTGYLKGKMRHNPQIAIIQTFLEIQEISNSFTSSFLLKKRDDQISLISNGNNCYNRDHNFSLSLLPCHHNFSKI